MTLSDLYLSFAFVQFPSFFCITFFNYDGLLRKQRFQNEANTVWSVEFTEAAYPVLNSM